MLVKKEKTKEKEASFFSCNEKKKRNLKNPSVSSNHSCDSRKSNYSSCYLNSDCFLKNISICRKCIFSYFDFENITKVIYMRHGARTPKKKIRNIWPFPEGKGDLTFLGFQQAIKIGKYLRKYYYSLRKLNKKYNNKYNKHTSVFSYLNKWIYKNKFLKLIREKKKNFFIKISQNKKKRKKFFKIWIHKKYFLNYNKESYEHINNNEKEVKLKNVVTKKSIHRNSYLYENCYTNRYRKKKENNNDEDDILEKMKLYNENALTSDNIYNNSKEKEEFLDIIKNSYFSNNSFLHNMLGKCKIDNEKKKYEKIIKLINKYLCIKTTNSERCKLTAYAIICGILGINEKMFFFFFLLSFGNDYENSNYSFNDKIEYKSKKFVEEKNACIHSIDTNYTMNNRIYEKDSLFLKNDNSEDCVHKIQNADFLVNSVKFYDSIYNYYVDNLFKKLMCTENYKIYNDETNPFAYNNFYKNLNMNSYNITQNRNYNCTYDFINNSILGNSINNMNHIINNGHVLCKKQNCNCNTDANVNKDKKNLSYVRNDMVIHTIDNKNNNNKNNNDNNNNNNNSNDDNNMFTNKSSKGNISTLNFNHSEYKEKSDFVNNSMNNLKYYKKKNNSKNFFFEENMKYNFMKTFSHSDNIITKVTNFKNLKKKSFKKMCHKFNVSNNLIYNMNVFFEFVMNNKNNVQFFYSKVRKTKQRSKKSLEKSYIYYIFQIYLQYILNKFRNHIINSIPLDNHYILCKKEDAYYQHSLEFEEKLIPEVYISNFYKTICGEKNEKIVINEENIENSMFNHCNNNIRSNNNNNDAYDLINQIFRNENNFKDKDYRKLYNRNSNINTNNNKKAVDYINNKSLCFDNCFNNIYHNFIEKYYYLIKFLNYINFYIRFFFYYLKNIYVLCSVVKVAERNSLMFKTLKAKNQYIKKLKNHIFNNSKIYNFLNNYYKEEISIVYYITKWKSEHLNTREILLKNQSSIYTPNIFLNNSILSTFKKHITSIYKLKKKLNNSIILRDLKKLNYSSVNTNFLNIQNYEKDKIHHEKVKNWSHFLYDKNNKMKSVKIIKKFISSYDAYIYHNVSLFFDFNNAYKKLSKEDSSDTMMNYEKKMKYLNNVYFFSTFQEVDNEIKRNYQISPINITKEINNEKNENINSYANQKKKNTSEEIYMHIKDNKGMEHNMELTDDNIKVQRNTPIQLNEAHDHYKNCANKEKYNNRKTEDREIYIDTKECCNRYIESYGSELIRLSLYKEKNFNNENNISKENNINKEKLSTNIYNEECKPKKSCNSFPLYEKEKKNIYACKNLSRIIKDFKNRMLNEQDIKCTYKRSKYINVSKKKKKNRIRTFYKNIYECYKLMCTLEYNNKYLSWLCSGMSLIDVAINFIINVRLFESFQKKKKKRFIPKIILYLTHQSALLSFQSCIGIKINNMKIPPFAGFISLELIRIKKRKIKPKIVEKELYNNNFFNEESTSSNMNKYSHAFDASKKKIFTRDNSKNMNNPKILNYINKNDTANIFCCKEDCVWKSRKRKRKKFSFEKFVNYKNNGEIEKIMDKKKKKKKINKYNDKYESFLPKCSNKIQDFKNLFFLLCYKDTKIEDLIELYNLCLNNDYTHIKNVHLKEGKRKRKRYFYGYFIKFTFNNYFPLKLKKKKSIRKYNMDKKKEDKLYNNYQQFQKKNCADAEKNKNKKFSSENQKEKKKEKEDNKENEKKNFKKNNITNRRKCRNYENIDGFNNITQNNVVGDNEKKKLIDNCCVDFIKSENGSMRDKKNIKEEEFQNEPIKLCNLKNQNINKNDICSDSSAHVSLINNCKNNKKIKKKIMKKLNMNNFNFNCKYDNYMNYIYNSRNIEYCKNYHNINKNANIKFTTKKSVNINNKLLHKYKTEQNESSFLSSEESTKDEYIFRKSKFRSLKIREQGNIDDTFEKFKKEQENSYINNVGYSFRLHKKNISSKLFKSSISNNKYIKKKTFYKRKGQQRKINYENENMICLDCLILYLKKMLSIYGNPEML